MKKAGLVIGLFVLLSCFAFAADSSVDSSLVSYMFINVEPQSDTTVTTSDVAFSFDLITTDGDEALPTQCMITLLDNINTEMTIDVSVDMHGHGMSSVSLSDSSYSYTTDCYDVDGALLATNTQSFTVAVIPPTPTTTGSSNGGGRRTHVNEEGAARPLPRRQVTNLSTSPPIQKTTVTEPEQKAGLARITGAVVGAFDDTGDAGILLTILIVALAGLGIYSRTRARGTAKTTEVSEEKKEKTDKSSKKK